MTKFRAGMISKLINKNAKQESEESEQDSQSDDELVEDTIFEKASDQEEEDDDEVDDGDGSELDDEALEDVKSDNEDEEDDEEIEEDEQNDDIEEEEQNEDNEEEEKEDNENKDKESVKNNKRKTEKLEKKSAKKVKKDNDNEEKDDEKEDEEGGEEKKIREREPETPEKLKRTLFIGNLPHDFNKKVFKTMLLEYGPLQNFRVRSVAPSKESLSKKVAYLAGKLNPNKTTVNVYAVYKEQESVTKALAMNGKEFEKHILRVDRCSPVKVYQNTKSTIFVGNIPTKATDNQLHGFFSSCGQINKVRIIRDRETCAGKGIGYVEFATKEAANAALEMNGQTFLNRELRVKEYYYKNNNNNKRFNQRRPFEGTQGQKKSVPKKKNGFQKNPAEKAFTGERATKKHFQKKGKIIKAKNALAKKKNLAKILTKK